MTISEKTFCLVDGGFDSLPEKCGKIIALSPLSSYYLDKQNVNYSCIEDYYSERDLRGGEIAYFEEQTQWFGMFDEVIQKKIVSWPFKKFALAHAFYSRLKYLVDSAIIRSHIVRKFIDKTAAKKIYYVGHYSYPMSDQEVLFYDFRSPFRHSLLPFFLHFSDQGKRYELSNFIYKKKNREGKNGQGCGVKIMHNPVREMLKNIRNVVRYKKMKAIMGARQLHDVNILFLDRGSSDIDPILSQLIGESARVFFANGASVMRVDKFQEKVVLDVDKCVAKDVRLKFLKNQFSELYHQFLLGHPIIQWINERCGFDVSEYILPYFKNFFMELCPIVCLRANIMRSFMETQKIQCVIARSCAELSQIGSLLAATDLGVEKICFQHGTGALQLFHYLNELNMFDRYFASDPYCEYFFLKMSERYKGCRAKIDCSSHYLKQFENKSKTGKFSLKISREQLRVTYVTHHNFTGMREFHNLGYPLVWYFEFQKRIIDYFGLQTKCQLIYKLPQGESGFSSAIRSYIVDAGNKNIKVNNNSFTSQFKNTDRVLMDYPATAFFESIVAGLPTFAICADFLELQEHQEEFWTKRHMLRRFSDFDHAVQLIHEFLTKPPVLCRDAFVLNEVDMVSYLKDKKGR